MQLTIDKAWALCIKQWREIIKLWRLGEGDICTLKRRWVRENNYDEHSIRSNCFFCEYARCAFLRSKSYDGWCDFCPAYKVDSSFHCGNHAYDYADEPEKFYKKILALNRKRVKKVSE
ncbi:MAG TPA: hypothetical protein ENH82_13725 [bacterium]|nr:hypothetical protein [bacterium]